MHDRRILTIQEQDNYENGMEILNKVCVYDLTNSIICDFNFDINATVYDIYQMHDDNIVFFAGKIQVGYALICKIKKKIV